jgi:hypothetical protein
VAAHASLGLSLDDLSAAVRGLGPPPAVKINLSALDEGARHANDPDHGHCAQLRPSRVTLEQASR